MKTKYPIQAIDLRFQVDHITPKKNQLFEEYRAAPATAKLFIILIRQREIEMISDGNKLIEVKVIKMTISYNYSYSNINYQNICTNILF